jgi:hypothetical protein
MKNSKVKFQEGSSFIVYSDVQERSAVTLRRSSMLDWEEPDTKLTSNLAFVAGEKFLG